MLIFQYHEKAESALKDYLADLIAKKVSTSFKLHRKDKMHLQLEPQKLPGLGLDYNFTGPNLAIFVWGKGSTKFQKIIFLKLFYFFQILKNRD